MLDPWGKGFNERLARNAERYDFIWTMAPTIRDAVDIPSDKFCLIPFPTGFGATFDEISARAPDHAIGFCGAIEDYNPHRYFWLLSEMARGPDLSAGIRISNRAPAPGRFDALTIPP